MQKTILGILLSTVCLGSFANTIECVSLENGSTLNMELRKIGAFENCFSLSAVPANTLVQFLVVAEDNVRSKVSLFDLNSGGVSSYIAEYDSDLKGSNGFANNTTNRNLAFSVTPISHLTTNKNVSITMLIVLGTAQILIDVYDVKSTPRPRPSPRPIDECMGGGDRQSSC